MVNVVKKGTNRPAAKAKSAKAAQRTPLPAKAPKAGDDPTALSMPMVEAVGGAKALELAETARSLGWEPEVTGLDANTVQFRATRGIEAVEVRWLNGRCMVGSTYQCGSRTVKIKNASAAKTQMSVPEDEAVKHSNAVVTRSAIRSRHSDDDDGTPKRIPLPFNAETSTDEEVIAAVIGKTITWRNNVTKELDSAQVMDRVPQKQLRIDIKHNRRILTFCAERGPFRSVYLDKILSVR